METPRRKFVESIQDVTPESIREREQAGYQAHEIYGLNADYLNKIAGFRDWYDLYKAMPEKKSELLEMELAYIAAIPGYREHFKNTASPNEALLQDAIPFIDAIDELVSDIKNLGAAMKRTYEQNGITPEIDRQIAQVGEAASMIIDTIRSTVAMRTHKFSSVNNLQTDPMSQVSLNKQYTQTEELEKIKQRLDYAKELLSAGPLPGSFSYLRNDGNVTPVDWKSTDEDKKKLEES